MSWRRFEMLCGEVFRRDGFTVEKNGLGGADRGIFITSGAYTAEATDFARSMPLDLIDGPALLKLVREAQKDRLLEPSPLPVRMVTAPSSPVCPRCGGSMVRRTAKRGSNAAGQFWGCSNFPKCRGVLEST